ncbi:hypothetical protein Syun_031805 [Stephania yunnanensis]|uniref:Uncharacterized protein n=1 Tax=Stephania yunnanensis TaxID=152371 RepID=A0AAP0E2R9_9MAGN
MTASHQRRGGRSFPAMDDQRTSRQCGWCGWRTTGGGLRTTAAAGHDGSSATTGGGRGGGERFQRRRQRPIGSANAKMRGSDNDGAGRQQQRWQWRDDDSGGDDSVDAALAWQRRRHDSGNGGVNGAMARCRTNRSSTRDAIRRSSTT